MAGIMLMQKIRERADVFMLVGVMIKMREEARYFCQLFGKGVIANKL